MSTHAPTPYCVVPDADSHGAQLCIQSADGSVMFRTPECAAYKSGEQIMIDEPNCAFVLRACNSHGELVAALRDAIDCMRTTEETGDDGASDAMIAKCVAVVRKVQS